MKKIDKILLAATSFAVIGLAVYFTQKHKSEKRLTQIAHEGYETAEDILFPMKSTSYRMKKS